MYVIEPLAENKLTSSVALEKVTFMNDSRFSTLDMFENSGKYDQIIKQWEDEMPRKSLQNFGILLTS
jgi:hypothetical protein